jgi:hypothetical protein
VILFQMLTGALPFVADDALALLDMHRGEPPPPVEALQPEAQPNLAALTAAALRKDPATRPADGAELLAALGGSATTAPLPPEAEQTRVLAPEAAPDPARPRRRTAGVALALLVLAAAGGALAWGGVTQPQSTPPPGDPSTGSATGAKKTHRHHTDPNGTTVAPTTAHTRARTQQVGTSSLRQPRRRARRARSPGPPLRRPRQPHLRPPRPPLRRRRPRPRFRRQRPPPPVRRRRPRRRQQEARRHRRDNRHRRFDSGASPSRAGISPRSTSPPPSVSRVRRIWPRRLSRFASVTSSPSTGPSRG